MTALQRTIDARPAIPHLERRPADVPTRDAALVLG